MYQVIKDPYKCEVYIDNCLKFTLYDKKILSLNFNKQEDRAKCFETLFKIWLSNYYVKLDYNKIEFITAKEEDKCLPSSTSSST